MDQLGEIKPLADRGKFRANKYKKIHKNTNRLFSGKVVKSLIFMSAKKFSSRVIALIVDIYAYV